LGFGCNEFTRIRNSHRTEEVRRRIGLSADQKLSGKILFRERGEEILGKIEKLSAECSLWGRNLPEQLDFDLPLRI
jgi:hypothetical protein